MTMTDFVKEFTESDLRLFPALAEILDRAAEYRSLCFIERYDRWIVLRTMIESEVDAAIKGSTWPGAYDRHEMVKAMRMYTAMEMQLFEHIPISEIVD